MAVIQEQLFYFFSFLHWDIFAFPGGEFSLTPLLFMPFFSGALHLC